MDFAFEYVYNCLRNLGLFQFGHVLNIWGGNYLNTLTKFKYYIHTPLELLKLYIVKMIFFTVQRSFSI